MVLPLLSPGVTVSFSRDRVNRWPINILATMRPRGRENLEAIYLRKGITGYSLGGGIPGTMLTSAAQKIGNYA